jgi:hypothetical protein
MTRATAGLWLRRLGLALVILAPALAYAGLRVGFAGKQRAATQRAQADQARWSMELTRREFARAGIEPGRRLPALPVIPALAEDPVGPTTIVLVRHIPYEPKVQPFLARWLTLLERDGAVRVRVVSADTPETLDTIRKLVGHPRLEFARVSSAYLDGFALSPQVAEIVTDSRGLILTIEVFRSPRHLAQSVSQGAVPLAKM